MSPRGGARQACGSRHRNGRHGCGQAALARGRRLDPPVPDGPGRVAVRGSPSWSGWEVTLEHGTTTSPRRCSGYVKHLLAVGRFVRSSGGCCHGAWFGRRVREVALEDAHCFLCGVAVGSGVVVDDPAWWVAAELGDGHAVEHGTDRPVAPLVEPMTDRFALTPGPSGNGTTCPHGNARLSWPRSIPLKLRQRPTCSSGWATATASTLSPLARPSPEGSVSLQCDSSGVG